MRPATDSAKGSHSSSLASSVACYFVTTFGASSIRSATAQKSYNKQGVIDPDYIEIPVDERDSSGTPRPVNRLVIHASAHGYLGGFSGSAIYWRERNFVVAVDGSRDAEAPVIHGTLIHRLLADLRRRRIDHDALLQHLYPLDDETERPIRGIAAAQWNGKLVAPAPVTVRFSSAPAAGGSADSDDSLLQSEARKAVAWTGECFGGLTGPIHDRFREHHWTAHGNCNHATFFVPGDGRPAEIAGAAMGLAHVSAVFGLALVHDLGILDEFPNRLTVCAAGFADGGAPVRGPGLGPLIESLLDSQDACLLYPKTQERELASLPLPAGLSATAVGVRLHLFLAVLKSLLDATAHPSALQDRFRASLVEYHAAQKALDDGERFGSGRIADNDILFHEIEVLRAQKVCLRELIESVSELPPERRPSLEDCVEKFAAAREIALARQGLLKRRHLLASHAGGHRFESCRAHH
jgi:hypothetical protein